MNKHKRYIPQRKKRHSKRRPQPHLPEVAPSVPAVAALQASEAQLVTHDEHLLEHSRTQWQFGDWESLAQLSRDTLQHHPDRAKLALLAAAGLLQQGDADTARQFVRLAQDWGCSKKLISQILVAGVHNTLARAAVVGGQEQRALGHFESAINAVMPSTDIAIWGHARFVRELMAMELLPQAVTQVDKLRQQTKRHGRQYSLAISHAKVLDMEVDWLRERVQSLQKQLDQGIRNSVAGNIAVAPRPDSANLSHKPPQYYGLHGLDKKLEAYIDYDNGYFVELGANDGISQSNTYYFEKERGWRGLLIEPIVHSFLKCKANRSENNAYSCSACVSFDYKIPYVSLVYSNLMTAPQGLESDISDAYNHANSGTVYLKDNETPVEVLAPARTLTSLLDEANAPLVIDLLSLDVEGAEIEVLKGIDFQKYRFKYLLIESRSEHVINNYISGYGYSIIDKLSNHDYLYAKLDR